MVRRDRASRLRGESQDMNIRRARWEEKRPIRDFYNHLIIKNAGTIHDIGWKVDQYPSEELLRQALERGELYVGENNGVLVCVMILNSRGGMEYDTVHWKISCGRDDFLVIHALGVAPEEFGKGYARQMVRFAVDTARQRQKKAIRLDVIEGNESAARLYLEEGFEFIENIKMYYAVTGERTFGMYEYRVD